MYFVVYIYTYLQFSRKMEKVTIIERFSEQELALILMMRNLHQLYDGVRFRVSFEMNEKGKILLIDNGRLLEPMDLKEEAEDITG